MKSLEIQPNDISNQQQPKKTRRAIKLEIQENQKILYARFLKSTRQMKL